MRPIIIELDFNYHIPELRQRHHIYKFTTDDLLDERKLIYDIKQYIDRHRLPSYNYTPIAIYYYVT